ncbi:unnamed protein product [Owenia fusiformis]|uniref:ATP-dependent DNA helicase II subunit 2 n=1 Tax=Owenia fusiformis TaxID=6347 RepID=A0A8S4N1B7_OWEFU|nr:unnamed protein product [Owenia fusiformis]
MAEKEAIAIVLDIGPSMNQAPPGEITSLQSSLNAITMILQRKIFAEAKDEVALVLCGTADTQNDLADGDSYENITVKRTLCLPDWPLLEMVQKDIQPSSVSGDFIDATVVAMDHLVKGIQGKKGFTGKRIILFSDLGGEFGEDGLEDIVASMKHENVDFNIIGPDFDEESGDGDAKGGANGHKKEKTAQQQAGEVVVRSIIEAVDGAHYAFSEALPALSFFQARQKRSMAWKVPLELGPGLEIPVQGLIKVQAATAKSFKKVYAKDPDEQITTVRTYHLNDDDETEIEKEDTVQGHRYGNTLVPFSQDDLENMKFKATKCLKLLCFSKSDDIKRHHYMGNSVMAFSAQKGDEAAALALSAIIKALYETNSVAIVRRCYSAAASPKIGFLSPHIKANYECLFYTELPFMEDLRQFTFGSLPIKEDNSDLPNKKQQPSSDQLKVMDDLIENMDLSKAIVDEDGDTEEAFKPKLTFNPYFQRLYQCIQQRGMSPDAPLPELSSIVEKSMIPPENIVNNAKPVVVKMKTLFKLEMVKKDKEEKTGQNVFKDGESSDGPPAKKVKVDDDLKGGMEDITKSKVTEVGTVDPVYDFKTIISQKDEDRFEEACKMMQKKLIEIVMDSFGTQAYSKAMDCLTVLRQESIKNSEPKMFNTYLRELKETIVGKGKKDFWDRIVYDKVTVIDKSECPESDVTKEEADRLLEGDVVKTEDTAPTQEEEADDLLAEMD